jgi:hypothetical protein
VSKPRQQRPARETQAALIETAARIMQEERESDPRRALALAAKRGQGGLASQREIVLVRQALRQRLALFEPHFDKRQQAMQRAASDAMQQLQAFEPHAIGGVLDQSLPVDAPIELELLMEHSDSLRVYLLALKIPFTQSFNGENTRFEFRAGDFLFCLHALTQNQHRSAGSLGLRAFQQLLATQQKPSD